MIVILLLVCVTLVGVQQWLLQRRRLSLTYGHYISKAPALRDLKDLEPRHELVTALTDLVETDGAGSWPPNAEYDGWPVALQQYKQILEEMLPLLATMEPSLDDEINQNAIYAFRSSMRAKLSARVNLVEVEKILAGGEAPEGGKLSRASYNGFFCCVANSRHAYRWAVLPIVKIAQREKMVDFPLELDVAWYYCQRQFGISADSGNNHCNVLCNYDRNGRRVFQFATRVSAEVALSEENFFRIFYDLEVLAFPIYYQMILAVIAFNDQRQTACRTHLQNIAAGLRALLHVYYKNMRNSRVGQKIWMRWVQGLQGWAAGSVVDGKFTNFNGISASQVLFFQAIDAFLGMEAFLSDVDSQRYVLAKQRTLVAALRRHSIRGRICHEDPAQAEIAEEFTKIVNQVKSFRAAHRTRCLAYLREPAPERAPMTAGMFQPAETLKSECSSTKTKGANSAINPDVYEPLISLLTSRLQATK